MYQKSAVDTQARRTLNIPSEVTEGEIDQLLRNLPKRKATGPDSTPNEILTLLRESLDKDLVHAISTLLARGTLPASFKESTTVVLRKEGKKDYSLPSSYRPIALENTLAKLVEKVIANRILEAAEEHGLLS